MLVDLGRASQPARQGAKGARHVAADVFLHNHTGHLFETLERGQERGCGRHFALDNTLHRAGYVGLVVERANRAQDRRHVRGAGWVSLEARRYSQRLEDGRVCAPFFGADAVGQRPVDVQAATRRYDIRLGQTHGLVETTQGGGCIGLGQVLLRVVANIEVKPERLDGERVVVAGLVDTTDLDTEGFALRLFQVGVVVLDRGQGVEHRRALSGPVYGGCSG